MWRTKIDGKFSYNREVGRYDKPLDGTGPKAIPRAAWHWLRATEGRLRHASTAGTDPTVYWLCLQYLRWAEGERDEGRLSDAQWRGQRSGSACSGSSPTSGT